MRTFHLFTVGFLLLLFSGWCLAQENHAELIEGTFQTPQEVTRACLECHEEVAGDIMHTSHWTWLGPEFKTSGGTKQIGKKNS